MLCPNDNYEMRQVKVEAHYGQWVILDQCPNCGGIWFDQSELYLPKQGQADKIELIDAEKLRIPSAIQSPNLICPKDGTALVKFNDPYFPSEIIILRCPLCDGLWLNRGEFTKYQTFRQTKLQKKEKSAQDIKLEQNIAQILTQQKGDDAVEILGRLGNFLSTPMDRNTMQPLEPARLSEEQQNAINLILNVLTVILRLFIRI